ncbi:MAG: helicase C-terminal domain-containing protein [Acholeplasmataceae bacterium]|jgi:DNA excision repair protein ERCC-2|nr:helicase C-terminal domain-containing protein [Acholeplasmataceae bacterium]
MRHYRVGVGELVSFLYASGDLSSETFQNVSLLEGTKAHQYVQKFYTSEDESELSIHYTYLLDEEKITLSGRIDGVLSRNHNVLLEEIKSTRKAVNDESFVFMNEHLAQLKVYAYMYMKSEKLTEIDGRLAYIQLSDYQMRYFLFTFYLTDLEVFIRESLIDYLDWMHILVTHEDQKNESIKELKFPFKHYRRGQRELMNACYQTIRDEDTLYAIAPTGIGKTMATLFSSIKSLTDPNQKIFYVTAKTVGKKIAIDTMKLLKDKGLSSKVIEITSKDTTCFLEKRRCDPEFCPFAKGFFDRLRDATIDIFQNEQIMHREVVESYARKHMICPFEFSLYVSYFVDIIIADYNYVFDPRIHLIRYFDDTTYHPIVLVDEAHNMISRSRDMYSSTLIKSDFILLRRHASKLKPSIRHAVQKVLNGFDEYEKLMMDRSFVSYPTLDNHFYDAVRNLLKKIENSLKENPKYPKKNEVLESYFSILSFVIIYEFYNDTYLTNIERFNDDVSLTLQCLDASEFIQDTVKNKIFGCIFFSATLHPVEYYQTLLTEGTGETLKILSPFDYNRLKLILAPYISTRYNDRMSSMKHVLDIIVSTITSKKGNYIVFFPSYQYLNQILELMPALDVGIITQVRDMGQFEREQVVNLFKDNEKTQVAFFVMGGMFSEGIDYIGDMLSGVIVVGVGLPMINESNDQLKNYYQLKFEKGFDYAYQYPGMNKVIQAVGRVIRTETDYGVAILIDDRFISPSYRKLFPPEWKAYETIKNSNQLKEILKNFWDIYEKKEIS